MFTRLLITLSVLAVHAGAATAAEKTAPVGQYVDLQPVGMPVVVKGQLLNYVFVYVRVNLAAGADVAKLRDKEPYFRDALVRAGHRTPFVLASDYEKIDEKLLTAAMMREASALAGPGMVKSVTVISQTTQKHVKSPGSPSPPSP